MSTRMENYTQPAPDSVSFPLLQFCPYDWYQGFIMGHSQPNHFRRASNRVYQFFHVKYNHQSNVVGQWRVEIEGESQLWHLRAHFTGCYPPNSKSKGWNWLDSLGVERIASEFKCRFEYRLMDTIYFVNKQHSL